jgi:hypothetical protein
MKDDVRKTRRERDVILCDTGIWRRRVVSLRLDSSEEGCA